MIRIDRLCLKMINSYWFIAIFLFFVASGFWFSQIQVLELFLANVGSSPLHFVYSTLDPVVSASDWPTGTRNLGKSLPINIYSWFGLNTDINLIKVMNVYIAIEIIIMLGAYVYFFKVCNTDNTIVLAIIFTLIVSLTAFQNMNLARFAYPFVWGLYYSAASALRILGIALVFKNKPWPASIALALSMLVHPLIGLIGVIAASAVVASRGLSDLKKYLLPAVIMVVITTTWFLFNFGGDEISSGAIPEEHWFALTKIFNAHWYPSFIGVFTSLSQYHFLPLLSLLLIYSVGGIYNKKNNFILNKEINVIVAVLSVVTLFGLIVSYFEINPFLVKLSLHRASDLLAVVVFIPVLHYLWSDICSTGVVRKSLALLLLLSPVMSSKYPGFPVVLSLIYTLPMVIKLNQEKSFGAPRLALLVWLIVLFILFNHIVEGYPGNYIFISVSLWVIPFLLLVFLSKKYSNIYILMILVWVGISIPVLNAERNLKYKREQNKAKYDMQLWARNNTANDALFMLDPTSYGGWRDISHRASFGTVKEWLHNAWLYDSDSRLYKEGLRRFSLLDLNPESFYSFNTRNKAYKSIRLSARMKYYNANHEFFKVLAEQENIDYFVFELKFMKNKDYSLNCVYKNNYYTICKL